MDLNVTVPIFRAKIGQFAFINCGGSVGLGGTSGHKFVGVTPRVRGRGVASAAIYGGPVHAGHLLTKF